MAGEPPDRPPKRLISVAEAAPAARRRQVGRLPPRRAVGALPGQVKLPRTRDVGSGPRPGGLARRARRGTDSLLLTPRPPPPPGTPARRRTDLALRRAAAHAYHVLPRRRQVMDTDRGTEGRGTASGRAGGRAQARASGRGRRGPVAERRAGPPPGRRRTTRKRADGEGTISERPQQRHVARALDGRAPARRPARRPRGLREHAEGVPAEARRAEAAGRRRRPRRPQRAHRRGAAGPLARRRPRPGAATQEPRRLRAVRPAVPGARRGPPPAGGAAA